MIYPILLLVVIIQMNLQTMQQVQPLHKDDPDAYLIGTFLRKFSDRIHTCISSPLHESVGGPVDYFCQQSFCCSYRK